MQQDLAKGVELWTQATKLGSSQAHYHLGNEYRRRGDSKKAKFHYGAAAMAGYETARFNLGLMEYLSGNMERYLNHLRIAASAGDYGAMHSLIVALKQGHGVSRDEINSTLTAYNKSCAEMRSKAREVFLQQNQARIMQSIYKEEEVCHKILQRQKNNFQ